MRKSMRSSFGFGALLLLTLLGSSLIGAAIARAVFDRGLTPEVTANLGVAVGTLALALITFVSVLKTNDVIGGEDRRHQIGFAPYVVIQVRRVEGKQLSARAYSAPEKYLVLYNQGFGIATDIVVEIENVDDVNTAIPSRDLGVKDECIFRVPADPPSGTAVLISYDDMFGNAYSTRYASVRRWDDFVWERPSTLRPYT